MTIAKRFWSKVAVAGPDDCWEWQACRDRDGYGGFGAGSRGRQRAHRFAYELTNGPIPDGMLVCHRCDNPPCCNPRHLFLGTGRDNSQDMVGKGRQVPARMQGEAHYGAKLTEGQVRAIRERHDRGEPTTTLGAEYGVTHQAIRRIVARRTWRHVA